MFRFGSRFGSRFGAGFGFGLFLVLGSATVSLRTRGDAPLARSACVAQGLGRLEVLHQSCDLLKRCFGERLVLEANLFSDVTAIHQIKQMPVNRLFVGAACLPRPELRETSNAHTPRSSTADATSGLAQSARSSVTTCSFCSTTREPGMQELRTPRREP